MKTFEVNIRVLGGLVVMYQFTKDPKVLAKAEDLNILPKKLTRRSALYDAYFPAVLALSDDLSNPVFICI